MPGQLCQENIIQILRRVADEISFIYYLSDKQIYFLGISDLNSNASGLYRSIGRKQQIAKFRGITRNCLIILIILSIIVITSIQTVVISLPFSLESK